jgi:hypothetical protein
MERHTVHFMLCSKEELQAIMVERGVAPQYGRELCRGFYQQEKVEGVWVHMVYILKKCPGHLALAAHELAHSFGLDHTWWPGIRNFTGLLRWFAFDIEDVKAIVGEIRLHIKR